MCQSTIPQLSFDLYIVMSLFIGYNKKKTISRCTKLYFLFVDII